jgi:hypothetical protein
MAIPESQLDTWSKQGSVTQSAATYETIRNVLNDKTSPFYSKDYSIFLQGSYGNDTNVFRDSDVDIVIRLNQTYYSNTKQLNEAAMANYEKVFSLATYAYPEFKADVLDWLRMKFGSDVKVGKKAIFIRANGARRNVDVLVCTTHRRYREGSNGVDNQYDEGISFWSDGVEINNFPKQHSENCTLKHQATNNCFKPLVRIYKNMRNRMVDEGYIAEGVAPSYFIEGMLWNVPNEKFEKSHQASFVETFNWILESDRAELVCANELHWLVRDNNKVCWSSADFDAYLYAVKEYWADWS